MRKERKLVEQEKLEKEKLEKLAAIKKQMEEAGLNVEDLQALNVEKTKRLAKNVRLNTSLLIARVKNTFGQV
ncbi:hypothetical protein KUL17_23710 [Alteromonas sp. KUL17]|nr:hypothetical protein KUL17_23710 [Alteromonas sp. KUL17]